MAGDNNDGSPHDPRKPRSPRRTGKPDLKVVASALEEQPRPEREPDVDAVAAALKDAEGDRQLTELGKNDPRVGYSLDGVAPGQWEPDEFGLPPGCPVLCLGTEDGVFYFIDTIGQLRAFKGAELGQAGINELFMGRHLWLCWAFPKVVKKTVQSWRPERAREALMAACARKGSWTPLNNVRGRGMWKGRDQRLILHCGDRLISNRGEEPLGELERMIYPTRPPVARPWPISLAGKPGPALVLYPHFATWNWARPLDIVLLIGWIAVGYLGAAAQYRPSSYVLGGKGTGKSALHDDIKALMSEWLVHSGDTTAAGIYQLLKFDCLPVAVDEFEAKADNRKLKGVIELMRISFSGAPMNRGGDNHKGTQFHGRSAFKFSSVNMPPMEPQDISRTAFLRLKKLADDAVKPIIAEEELAELGRKILRRLMDNWHRWHATLTAWREFLASCGHDGRGQDTFGTLLAAADLVIADDAEALGLELGPNAENFETWRPLLEVAAMPEYQATAENHEHCLSHMLSTRIEAWRGGTRHTVGEVLAEFWEADQADADAIKFGAARKLLEQAGLALLKPQTREQHWEILVPFNNPLLYQVFRDSKWAGELGAGSWTEALRQAPTEDWRDASARINGQKFKGTAFRLDKLIISEKDARS